MQHKGSFQVFDRLTDTCPAVGRQVVTCGTAASVGSASDAGELTKTVVNLAINLVQRHIPGHWYISSCECGQVGLTFKKLFSISI